MKLSEEQLQLREIARTFLGSVPGPRETRATGYDQGTWERVVEEQGWPALAIPEEAGGFGFGLLELGIVMEELGRSLVGTPLLGTAVAAFALQECGEAEHLEAVAAGRRACFALGDVAVDAVGAELAVLHDGEGFLLIESPTVEVLDGLDPTRTLGRVSGTVRRLAGGDLGTVLARAAVLLAFEQVGVAEACLDLAVDYAKVRQQFGRPIGAFQAIKHKCADMLLQVESARSAALGAAVAFDAGDPDARLGAHTAKAWCSDAAFACAGECIQVHGGIGFTWEHDAHLYFKRARATQTLFGHPRAHRAALSVAVLQGAEPLPANSSGAEDEAFRQQVRGWLEEHLQGDFAELRGRGWPGDMDGAVEGRRAWEQRLAEGRWTGLTWPVEVGGRGASLAQEVIFLEEYARADAPGRVGHIGEGLLGPTVIAFGTEAQKQRFLPPILDGTELWCQGYSEPGAGSDLANVQCTAELRDGRWVVNGQKVWTSLASISEWCFALCRTRHEGKKHHGISCLLIPMDQPGITIVPIEQITGSSEFAEVFFDDAVTAEENVVGDVHGGWKVAMGTLAFERGASTLAQQLSFANELKLVLEAAKRTGTAEDPVVRQELARSWMGLRIMRLNALRMLTGHQDGRLSREALITKLYWANWHRDLGELAMDVLGDEALHERGALERLFLWTRCDTIYAGTNQIQRNIIGERGLGLPR